MAAMDALETYRSDFRKRNAAPAGKEPGWLSRVRQDALERFVARGFPSTDQEEWRFTNVAPLARTAFELAPRSVNGDAATLLERIRMGTWKRYELVFVNGRLVEDLSSVSQLPPGVMVTSLSRALESEADRLEPFLGRAGTEEDTPFYDLNRAFLSDGAFILVSKGTVLDAPIHLVFLTLSREPVVSHPHNVILVEPNSQVQIVETYGGPAGAVYFTNGVTELAAGENAIVDHYKLQRESEKAFHMATLSFIQGRSAALANHSLSVGGRLVRNDIRSLLDGEGTDVTLNGLYVVRERQHVDHHTVIDHKEPHGTSRELYKGILDDQATSVFNGRIIVRADAQKTDARQTNKNLLLSEDALVNTNPQLEINADDVKCAHGATIGQLDAEALFYLRSRGIPLDQARDILTRGFMAEVSERIRIDAIRDGLRKLLFAGAA